MSGKRKAEDVSHDMTKRGRYDTSTALVVSGTAADDEQDDVVERTSSLSAPTLVLEGHGAPVNSVKFSSDGNLLASASSDKSIMLWRTFASGSSNYLVMNGHRNAVLELHWSAKDDDTIYTASADKTVGIWDTTDGTLIRRMTGHQSIVNSVCPVRRGPELLISGSDDGLARVWDARVRRGAQQIEHDYPVTAVCFGDQSSRVYTAGIDNIIRAWDLRNVGQPVSVTGAGASKEAKDAIASAYSSVETLDLSGHVDTPTSLALSPRGTEILSNAMDSSVRLWDVQPFVVPGSGREKKRFDGAKHGFEKTLIKASFSPDGALIGAGSADRNVFVWDATTAEVLYCLPGHKGTVNEVAFHPTEPIIVSCGVDKQIFLGELN